MNEKFDLEKIKEEQKKFDGLPKEEKDEIVDKAKEEARGMVIHQLFFDRLPESMKKTDIEDSQMEARRIREKLWSGKFKEFNEADESVEKDKAEKRALTFEQYKEKIMELVQDINDEGTAYTVLGAHGKKHKIEKMLDSVLGDGLHPAGIIYDNSDIHFNIVGRANDLRNKENEIKNSFWWRGEGDHKDSTVILFNIDGFKEVFFTENIPGTYRISIHDYSHKIFEVYLKYCDKNNITLPKKFKDIKILDDNNFVDWIKNNGDDGEKRNNLSLLKEYFDEKGRALPDSEEGFIFHGGISPDRFRGIVIENHEQLSLLTKSIEMDFYKNKESRSYIPIYDIEGNLLWPKKMSYEEVKKFAEEREKDKK